MDHDQPSLPAFDAAVAEYELYAEPATAAFGARALAMLAVRPGEKVLDVAAGTGALTLPLLDAGATVTATDLSPPMVARLAARIAAHPHAAQGVARIEDGQALSFPDGRFDAAVSMFGVMLFPDWALGLREIARVLRPGGRVALGSWSGLTAPMRLLTAALAAVTPDRVPLAMPPGVAALGEPDGMAAALAGAGLAGARVEQLTLPWISPPLNRLVVEAARFFAHIPPFSVLSSDERARVTDAMRAIAATGLDFTSTATIGVAVKPG